jgi:hypothetical protein
MTTMTRSSLVRLADGFGRRILPLSGHEFGEVDRIEVLWCLHADSAHVDAAISDRANDELRTGPAAVVVNPAYEPPVELYKVDCVFVDQLVVDGAHLLVNDNTHAEGSKLGDEAKARPQRCKHRGVEF